MSDKDSRDIVRRYEAELALPTPTNYAVAHNEQDEAYKVTYRLVTAVEHTKTAVDGLVELDEHITRKGIANPAVLAMARRMEMVYMACAEKIIADRMIGRGI